MKSILVFDTETTGLVDRNLPPEDERQPDVVQFAAMLCTAGGEGGYRVRQAVSVITQPPKHPIHPKARAKHGIGPDDIARFGVPYGDMLGVFGDMVDRADVIVAHNLSFDALVVRTAWHRGGLGDLRDRLLGKRAFCTMKAATPVCKILSLRARHRTDYKWPSLAEATEFFFAEKLVGAHDALVDVAACARIYFELERRKALTPGASGATEGA
jgi:DNA polymerase-3 subunit epsilon